MLDIKDLTDKQIKTLCYFALGFSTKKVARKQQCSVSTIRQRLKAIIQKHPQAFDNACSIRNAYKLSKHNIEHPLQLDEVLSSLI